MHKITTTLGKQTANQPTNYEFSKIAFQRNLLTSSRELKEFKYVEAGALGEERFADILLDFGQSHWYYFQNLWLNDYTTFECDYLLLTNTGIYVFEIKNYFGLFEYKNGQCKSRGINISYNPINQANNATIHLKNLLSKFPANIPIKGVLVFIGEHNKIQIHDEIDYIDIITRNEIYEYIESIIKLERSNHPAVNPEQIIRFLENFEVPNPYLIQPFNHNEINHSRNNGIYCLQCAQSVSMTRGNYITCPCGFQEYRDHAIIRTICEYGVLTYGTHFIPSNLQQWLGSPISIHYLTKVLKRYFPTVPRQNILTFENYGRDIQYLPIKLAFKHPNIHLQLPK